jgi:hypothetical protein
VKTEKSEKSTELKFMESIGFDPYIAAKAAALLAGMDKDMRMQFWLKFISELEDYDPTPCCYQHGVGAIGTNEKCPDIADND